MYSKNYMRFGIAAVLALLLAVPAGGVLAADDSKKMSLMPRASELIGKDVKNDRGADLGEVQDVVIGRYRDGDYLIISRDPGIGAEERLIPVPFHSDSVYVTEDHVVLRGIEEARLDSAPSFTKNEWRMLENDRFRSDVRGYYGQSAAASRDYSRSQAQAGKNRGLVGPSYGSSGNTYSERGMTSRAGSMATPRASDLIGKTVKNDRGANLGEVSDVAFGNDRDVDFLIISRDRVAGAEDRLVPVPFDSNHIYVTEDSVVLRGIDQAMLDNAPSFTEKEWRLLDDQRFRNDVRGYYGQTGVYRQDYYPRGYRGTGPDGGVIVPTDKNPDNVPPSGLLGPTPGSSGNTEDEMNSPGNRGPGARGSDW